MWSWITWIVKKLVSGIILRVIWSLVKDHPWSIAAATALSWLLSHFAQLDWGVWFFGIVCIVSLFMGMWEKWLSRRLWALKLDRKLFADIDRAVLIPDAYNLFLELKNIYPRLERYGISMPALTNADHPTWRQYHINFLSRLRRRIRQEGSFTLEEWKKWVEVHEEKSVVERLNKLELQMLRLIYDQLPEHDVTTSTVYAHKPFLDVAPRDLYGVMIHLSREGYIEVTEDEPVNPFAPLSARMWTVTRVTQKGRLALETSGT